MTTHNVVIIGSGPAGSTAALYAARANLNPIVLHGTQPGGQLTQTTDVENFPGFVDGISGFELVMIYQKQAERFGACYMNHTVKSVDFKDGGPQKLLLDNGEEMLAKTVIIATGASARWLGLESEQRLMNKGVSGCATCDGAFFRNVPIVVVGGGDTAAEEALFLTRFASQVYLVHRRDELRASKVMADRVINHEKVTMVWDSVVEEIIGDEKVTGVKLLNRKTNETTELECGAVFMAIGHTPNTKVFADALNLDESGYIVLPDTANTYTNIEGVFAAGDCSDHVYRQAVVAAGMGCKAAIDAERWLAEQE